MSALYTAVATESLSSVSDELTELQLTSARPVDTLNMLSHTGGHGDNDWLNAPVQSDATRRTGQRKWQVFPGKNKFCCDGRLMMSHETGVFYLTVFLILTTSALFFAFDCPFLFSSVSPLIPVVDGFLFVFVLSTLFRTSFTDPGVLPRATAAEAEFIERQIELVPGGDSESVPMFKPPPRTRDINIRGQVVTVKYCFTCKIFRPPRASHCSICDNCVDRFDHHCPWVGNCVGQRNYRYFYLFLVSLSVHAVYIFIAALAHLILLSQTKDFLLAVQTSPASVVVCVICFFSVWSVVGLAGFHTYLTLNSQTTNEDIKGTYSSRGDLHDVFNPFSHGGCCTNFCANICGPVMPSVLDRRGLVAADVDCVLPVSHYGTTDNTHNNTAQHLTRDDHASGDMLLITDELARDVVLS